VTEIRAVFRLIAIRRAGETGGFAGFLESGVSALNAEFQCFPRFLQGFCKEF
jgi:hypothetical protein